MKNLIKILVVVFLFSSLKMFAQTEDVEIRKIEKLSDIENESKATPKIRFGFLGESWNAFNQMNCAEEDRYHVLGKVSVMDETYTYGGRATFARNGDYALFMGGPIFGLSQNAQLTVLFGGYTNYWKNPEKFNIVLGVDLWMRFGIFENQTDIVSGTNELLLFRSRSMFSVIKFLSVGAVIEKDWNLQWSAGPLVHLFMRPVKEFQFRLGLGYLMTSGKLQYEGKIEGRPLLTVGVKFSF